MWPGRAFAGRLKRLLLNKRVWVLVPLATLLATYPISFGALGGRLLWNGPPPPAGDSPTARWLRAPEHPPFRPVRPGAGSLSLAGLTRHNLRDVSVELKLEALNVITGISGAGKTSLLTEAAARLEQAIGEVLAERQHVTSDLGGTAGTREMGKAVIDRYIALKD